VREGDGGRLTMRKVKVMSQPRARVLKKYMAALRDFFAYLRKACVLSSFKK
jgi:hypothetical protein